MSPTLPWDPAQGILARVCFCGGVFLLSKGAVGNALEASLWQISLSTQALSSVVCVCLCECLVAQWCPALCDPIDCGPPGSSVHGISQARILEWVTVSSSRGSSWPRDGTRFSHISCISRQSLYHCTAWKALPNVSYKWTHTSYMYISKAKDFQGEKEAWFKGVQINMHQLLDIPLKFV